MKIIILAVALCMAEGDDEKLVSQVVKEIAGAVKKAAA